jgi:hypothetical protein
MAPSTRPAVRRASVLAALAAVAVVSVDGAAIAAPGPPAPGGGHKPDHCVSQAEYDAVAVHQTRTSVHKSFGTTGRRTSVTENGPRTDEVRVYKVCHSPASTVTVSYRRAKAGPFRVISKSAVWVD